MLFEMLPVDYSVIPKIIRVGFLFFGVGFVLYGFYGTMVKVNQSHILINEEVVVEEKYTYPSITFCYKYKHGGKDVLKNYYPSLFDKWKKLGKLIMFIPIQFKYIKGLKCYYFYFHWAPLRFVMPRRL